MTDPTREASLERGEAGLLPAEEGWFVVNVADAEAVSTDRFGKGTRFENARIGGFAGFGVNVRLLEPGQPASLYHREHVDEAFLVLGGQCVAIVEDSERPMRKGDFLYAPAGTAHVLVGAGEGPCSIVMFGLRRAGSPVEFPFSETAARHGASAAESTDDAQVAYADTRRLDATTIPVAW